MATIAILKEHGSGERRVALDPPSCKKLIAQGHRLQVQREAGTEAGFNDQAYQDAGASVLDDAAATLASCDCLLWINPPAPATLKQLASGRTLIGQMLPGLHDHLLADLRAGKHLALGMELVPRISRAQSMDVLSSQATIAGYQAALIGADLCPRVFPMLTTAAGTLRPAKVVIIGAGVAGLQAIATCRRLGAQVEAYDIRAAAREQVQSLGARMIDTGVDAETEGGYARDLTDAEKQQQADALAKHLAMADVVISTAAIPGRPAPKIITKAMVDGMQSGAVIVDLAAETGGNCELTQRGETIVVNGVTIAGVLNLPSRAPLHASEMYARNLLELLKLVFAEDGSVAPQLDDEVIAGCLLSKDGRIVHKLYADKENG
ncbi:MAG: NAD(P) transhydrogenase subunit alpha [Gammaproteobacteria bacterium]|jgi:NAD(P) transhydrogenase subunit alpha|nr:NAD(P) transhydrogenase subunit alpha [Gammaproteobacteria bacterium]